MMHLLRFVALTIALVLATATAQGEKLVSTLSNEDISITSSFDGETLTLFGNAEPDTGSDQKFVEGPFHVIVVVTGPEADWVARRKSNVFGIWLNTEQVRFAGFPSYYQVISSAKLTDITDPGTLATERILPSAQAELSAEAGWWNSAVFAHELVRLMTEKGRYGLRENAVNFLSETAYSASLTLPSDVPNGRFLAHTYLFKDGKIVAEKSDGFLVRKTGFERFLGTAAVTYPLLYGLVCVMLALFTGWLGGVVFKR